MVQDTKKVQAQYKDGVVIKSQADMDSWEASKKDLVMQLKKDVIITKFLYDIKRRRDLEDELRREREEFGDEDEDDNQNGNDGIDDRTSDST